MVRGKRFVGGWWKTERRKKTAAYSLFSAGVVTLIIFGPSISDVFAPLTRDRVPLTSSTTRMSVSVPPSSKAGPEVIGVVGSREASLERVSLRFA